MWSPLPLLGVIAVTVVASCAPAASGTRGSRDVITRAAITEVGVTTAWEAVEKLKPHWLRSRGPSSGALMGSRESSFARVYRDGTQAGSLEYLRSVRVDEIEEIRYLSAGAAQARFGPGHERGVIHVISASH